MKNEKTNIAEYDLLRVVVTVLVIVGHCTYYKIVTPYGGCDYMVLNGYGTFYRVMGYVNTIVYAFHMPLYMALSGALYEFKNVRGGVQHL